MLVMMLLTHLPTRLTSPVGQPFGYVSAAEGFVLLSAYVSGMVYSRLARKKGLRAMGKAFLLRALKVYWCHAATLIFLFTVVAAVGLRGEQPAVTDLMSFYLAKPVTALATGLLLIYTPPLLDILPLYLVFMLVTPWLLAYGIRKGWRRPLLISVIIWLLAQFGLGQWLYQGMALVTGLTVPIQETGSFVVLAWQLLWVVGLWMGSSRTDKQPRPFVFPRWIVNASAMLVVVSMVWRHIVGQVPFGDHMLLNLLFDKWQLGPLRLLNLFAMIVVVISFGPALAERIPRPRVLETLGAASLEVFCAHLMLVLLALAVFGADPWRRPWWGDALLLAVCFSLLYAVARFTLKSRHPKWPVDGTDPPPLRM